MTPFHLIDMPAGPATRLDLGPRLLEASAGTGKTYTIAGIVVRLIVEEGLGIDTLVVTTFTVAATAELRERIRATLRDAVLALTETTTALGSPFVQWLAARWRVLPSKEQQVWRDRLLTALENVDASPIATIHAFGRRLALEESSRLGLDPEAPLVLELTEWRNERIRDWFRRELLEADSGVVGVLGTDYVSALQKAAQLSELFPLAVVQPQTLTAEQVRARLAQGELDYEQWIARLSVLRAGPLLRLAKNSMHHPDNLGKRLDLIEAWFHGRALSAEDRWTVLELTDPDRLDKVASKAPGVDIRVFSDLPRLLPDVEGLRAGMTAAFVAWYRQQLTNRPSQAADSHVNDALWTLAGALHRDPLLGPRLASKYAAVLVDEFQDTDVVQWRILSRCFLRPDARLYLIGDPKQAIYGFRGADVATYGAARALIPADRRNTLDTNFRSDAVLVHALEQLYLGDPQADPPLPAAPDAFADPLVHYLPVSAAHGQRLDPGSLDAASIQLWALDEGLCASAEAQRTAQETLICQEIQALLDPAIGVRRTLPGEAPRRIVPGDIAILVRSHREADSQHQALARVGIPAVRLDTASVYGGTAARMLLALLEGCIAPSREVAVRGAASSLLIQAPAKDLAADPPGPALSMLSHWLAVAGETLRQRGIIAWWYGVLDRDWGWGSTRQLLAGRGDGGRLLMDAHHVVELLASEDGGKQQGSGQDGHGVLLTTVLAQHIARAHDPEAGRASEARARRLERDDAAVRIMTVFVSKGLQFPIVFAAFVNHDIAPARPPCRIGLGTLVDQEPVNHLVLGPLPEDLRVSAAHSQLAEEMRLLYVGLTRAEHRLYIPYVPFIAKGRGAKPGNSSAISWLLCGRKLRASHASGSVPGLDPAQDPMPVIAVAAEKGPWLGSALTCHHISVLNPTIAKPDQGFDKHDTCNRERDTVPAFVVPRAWSRCSFTGLTRWREAEIARELPGNLEERDQDQGDRTTVSSIPGEAGADVPGGATLGAMVHGVYEHGNFAEWRRDPSVLVTAIADRARQDGVYLTSEQVLYLARIIGYSTSNVVPGLEVALADLPAQAVAREWPIRVAIPRPVSHLGQLLKNSTPLTPDWPARWDRLTLPAGVFTGVLDALVMVDERLHVIDWKTNRLVGYGAIDLAEAMAESDYYLQAHLYLLAVHRFQRIRVADYDPRRHLGVAAYAFLRGHRLDDPAAGWVIVNPDLEMLTRLDETLR